MSGTTRPVLLVRRGAADVVAQGCTLPVGLGSTAGVVTRVATLRLMERRLLGPGTVLSECVATRLRGGMEPDTTVHDLLAGAVPGADALLERCIESVTGRSLAATVREELIGPLGMKATAWEPAPTSTAADLGLLVEALAAGDLPIPPSVRAAGGTPGHVGFDGVGSDGPVAVLRLTDLDLTIVAATARIDARWPVALANP
jgi:hypothetical protein